jgi:hypothetical protein
MGRTLFDADFKSDFDEFWRAYPRRVGKLAASKAYAKARRGGITREELLDGVAEYIRSKPSYQDFCHPTTWLNQGRWMDESSVQPQEIAARCSKRTARLLDAVAEIEREAGR